ncbi:hypothetical protein GTV32_20475 [Gordonia sp. SID5947]|uniref:alpha/beta hydrolase n=1 Tax=Gordonia sp. SID5947 TaxID=2690315 RepID=UPI00136AE79F|nr:alpha/beta hydrolase [Gordonia sp. SID5947]MYR08534.1 hypothetical protein [Gordonia sp. SID5947]
MTRPTIAELREWDISRVTAASAAAADGAASLDGALDAAIRAFDAASDWRGDSRASAEQAIARGRDQANEIRNVLNQIADEANDAGADLTHARELVLRQVDAAITGGFVVTDVGTVAHADSSKAGDATMFEAAIASGLDAVARLDDEHGARLDGLADDLVAARRGGDPDVPRPAAPSVNPEGTVSILRSMTPVQRHDLWSRIPADERRRIMHADPQTIGNLDGVDFDTRADANEINIRNALIEERQAGRAAGPRAAVLEDFLRRVRDPDGADDTAERRFIVFENTAGGRSVEMVGTIGPGIRTATVYVPGTHSNMNRSSETADIARDLAQRTDGPVFVYLDGDLPQKAGFEGLTDALGRGAGAGPIGRLFGMGSALVESIDGSAVETGFARIMAPRLVGFGAALDAELARYTPDAKTTFIGHSYGGSVVGSAEQLGLRADRVVYASSAGTGVFDGPWRNANPHVERYSLTAPGDPIQYVQSVPGNPHGADPDVAPGVVRMDTGFTGPDATGHRALLEGAGAHSSYWHDPDSDAFRNVVRVINGDDPTRYVRRTGDIDLPGRIPDIPLRVPW